ncbi:MAG: 4-hydroxy-3-methylbut-2-en-1-yl diphosphate synthase [Lachnospiraceae bacterium]|nr:4-hydroxy-3-methylbut-2-en-1-yl diphosphate synthase [Lachnospiraceae bacterium]
MYELDKVKNKLERGELIFITNSLMSDPSVSELMAFSGSDIIWIDMEHGAIDYKDVELHIIAAHSGGAAVFIRIPWNDPVMVKKVIDMGPDGIIFPLVKNAGEVERAIRACEYPPNGIRGWNPIRAVKYGVEDGNWYKENASRLTWKIMMIEDIEAVRDLDRILEVEGLDALMIGPSDLSGSMGKLLDTQDQEVQDTLDFIVERCREKHVPVGVALGCGIGMEAYEPWIRRGVQMMSVGQDVNLLVQATRDNISHVKQAIENVEEKRYGH